MDVATTAGTRKTLAIAFGDHAFIPIIFDDLTPFVNIWLPKSAFMP